MPEGLTVGLATTRVFDRKTASWKVLHTGSVHIRKADGKPICGNWKHGPPKHPKQLVWTQVSWNDVDCKMCLKTHSLTTQKATDAIC